MNADMALRTSDWSQTHRAARPILPVRSLRVAIHPNQSRPSCVSRNMALPQFGLRTLLIFVSACCVLFAAIGAFGSWPVMATLIIGLAKLSVLIPCCYALMYASSAVKHVVVCLVLFVVKGSLLVCWVHRSRERSRIELSHHRLRQLDQRADEHQQWRHDWWKERAFDEPWMARMNAVNTEWILISRDQFARAGSP